MASKQNSLVFWIIFLVLVAVSAALFFPRYNLLAQNLNATKVRDFANILTASTAANFTLRKANPTKGFAIRNCKEVANLVGDNLPPGYEIADEKIASGDVIFCTLKGAKITSIQFSVIGIN